MIVVIGEILIDIFKNYQRIGGAPFNFAFHLKQLGFPVRFMTRVGNDQHGKGIIDMLEEKGFDSADVQIDPRHPTGTVRVDLDEQGIPHFDIRPNAAYDHLDLTIDPVRDVVGWEMVYFGTLIQRTDSTCHQVQRFLSCTNDSVTRFCDINMRSPHVNVHAVAGSLESADLLKVNDEELAEIQHTLGGPISKNDVIPWLMETFRITAVALTRGIHGSRFYSRDGQISIPAVTRTPIVDTVGAGDGYAAILAAGYMRQIPWEETIRQASRFAARLCGIPGAVPEDEDFYDDFRPLMKGEANGR